MVRDRVVKYPEEWAFCGYHEIHNPRKRYGLIDYQRLVAFLQMRDLDELQESCRHWIDDAIGSQNCNRESKWTESIAVGSKRFVEATKERLGIKARGRKVLGENGTYELREPQAAYGDDFTPENGGLRAENTYFWDVYPEKSVR